jgi:hypothetical protein
VLVYGGGGSSLVETGEEKSCIIFDIATRVKNSRL